MGVIEEGISAIKLHFIIFKLTMRINYKFLEGVFSKWDYIREQFEFSNELINIDEKIVKEEWKTFEYKGNNEYSIVCGDGSYNTIEYIDKYIILSSGVGLFFDSKNSYNENYTYLSFVLVIPFDVLVRKFLDDLASLIMSTLELKSIYLMARKVKHDIILIDGSIRSLIIRFGPSYSSQIGQRWFYKGEIKEKEIEEIYYENKDDIYNYDLWSYHLVKNFNKENKFIYFAHLLYYEYLKVLNDLLTNFEVVSISKSFSPTTGEKIFNLIERPDIIIFEEFTKEVGYSKKVKYLDEDEFYKWKLPQPFEHLKKKQIFFFYTRFEENHRVYKVEFIKDKEQEEILKIIYPTIVKGYPVILKIAHNDALITDSDAQIFEQHIRNELKGQIGIKLREELL